MEEGARPGKDSGKHASSGIEGGFRLKPTTNVVRKGGGVEEGGRGTKAREDLQADLQAKRRSRRGNNLIFYIWVPRASGVVRNLFLTRFGSLLDTISVPFGALGGSSGTFLRTLGFLGGSFGYIWAALPAFGDI